MNNNSFSNNRIRFNTKEISNYLVSYEDAYILLEVDTKFKEAANALPASIGETKYIGKTALHNLKSNPSKVQKTLAGPIVHLK